MRIVCLAFLLLIISCKSNTGIEGDDNDNNKVVVGNNNVITFNGKDYNRPINKDLSVNISSNNELTQFVRQSLMQDGFTEDLEAFSRIKYKSVQKNGAVILNPDIEFLELFQKGGPVTNVFNDVELNGYTWGTNPRSVLTFPNLDLKMVNNSQNSVFFNKVVFNIRSSRKVKAPLVVPIRTMDEEATAAFGVLNEGWFDLKSCEVLYNIYAPNTKDFNYGNTPFTKNITSEINKDHDCTISIDAALQSRGIDTRLLRKYISEDPTKLESVLREYYSKSDDEYLNPLIAAGKIKYTFLDENNNDQTKEVKFFVPIELEGGYGAPSPVTDHFNAKFQTDKENYTVEVPVSNTLKPTESDRINIMIAADQTSTHDFSAKLYYNDTSYYETGPIQLHYFLPFSANELYKDALKNLKKKTLYK